MAMPSGGSGGGSAGTGSGGSSGSGGSAGTGSGGSSGSGGSAGTGTGGTSGSGGSAGTGTGGTSGVGGEAGTMTEPMPMPDYAPSPNNPPECPAMAPPDPVGDCLGLPVYLVCEYGDDSFWYVCTCDWYHWLCAGT
jgi:hypothetical protein